MSDPLRVETDARDAAVDFYAAASGLYRVTAKQVSDVAEDISHGARQNMKAGATTWAVRPGELPLPHIRDTYTSTATGLVAVVASDHPAAGVWESGGDIHPHSPQQVIAIPRAQPVERAASDHLDLFEIHMRDSTDRLLAAFHL